MTIYRFSLSLCLIAAATPGLVGCHRGAASSTNAMAASTVSSHNQKMSGSHPAAPLTADQLKQAKPNEAGLVPILEYHNIKAGTPRQVSSGMFRSPDEFRKDLQRLYDENYRPVNLSEYLDDRVDLPYGKSPVVLTFDDAYQTQFSYLPDGSIDPNCGIGILQAFHKAHPDFAVKGTFFVLPTQPGFGPREETAKKLQALLAMGCEIGNHTIHHYALSKLSDEKVQEELADCASTIEKMAPQAHVDTLALPYGIAPHNKALEADGQYNGIHYHNRAVLLVGAGPARAPIAKKFNPLKLPRIQANEKPFGITFCLDRLKPASSGRYISDGDVNVVTFPKNLESKIDRTRLHGAAVRTYGG